MKCIHKKNHLFKIINVFSSSLYFPMEDFNVEVSENWAFCFANLSKLYQALEKYYFGVKL